ncbi:MAG: transglycosylase domain-containing protein [Treponema sp.]|nr:transglycosylase domain-containing protein [Candidatus Treponema equifaecale]
MLKRKVFIPLFLISLLVLVLCAVIFSPFPALKEFLKHKYSVQILDCNGNIIQITPVENGLRREFTPISEIPEKVQHSILDAEDGRFYKHPGIDLMAASRAVFQNTKEARTVSGASTITMQLAKMVSPSPKRNMAAKFKDVVNALKIEAKLSKTEILELYLNNLPFGNNVEGVTSASRYYFSKNLDELTENQLTSLAQIPRNPSLNNPFKNPEITEAKKYKWPFEMPHYVNFLKGQLGERFGTEITKLKLDCDLDLQQLVQGEIFAKLNQAKRSRIENAAAIVIHNKTGNILAWVGSNDWFDQAHSGQIDGVLVPNQPGSSMKPFLYALALEQNFKPNMVLADVPMEFGQQKVYIPFNFNNRFNGPVLFRNALASSLNIPAVHILEQCGVENYLSLLNKLGFYSLEKNGRQADLGLALGAGEVSLYELARAFTVFANDGALIVFSENGEKTATQIFDSDTARIICDILSDKTARVGGFGFTQSFQTEYPSIFKTGTANQYQSIVALGATTEYTVGVWMGNLNGNTVIGKTGSSLPAGIAKSTLDYLVKKDKASNTIPQTFKLPENYTKIKICQTSGMAAGKYCPRTLLEFAKNENLETERKNICSWHSLKNAKLITSYPAEYQQWLSGDFKNSILNNSSQNLKIISPKNKSIFYASTREKDENQIAVEIIGGKSENEELKVYIDGKPVESEKINRPFKFFIPAEKGNHQLKVQLVDEKDEIEFEVK